MKNTLEGIITEADEWITELEDKLMQVTATEENKEKKNENEHYLGEHWDNINALTFSL